MMPLYPDSHKRASLVHVSPRSSLPAGTDCDIAVTPWLRSAQCCELFDPAARISLSRAWTRSRLFWTRS